MTICEPAPTESQNDTTGCEVKMVQRNIAPPSLPALLAAMADFDDAVFDRIANELEKPSSTNLAQDQFDKLANDVDQSEINIRLLMSLLSYLYGQTSGLTTAELKEALADYLSKSVSDDVMPKVERLADKLAHLLSFRSAYEASEKKQRLSRGSLPFVLASSSFVDLRTDFCRNDEGELTGEIADPIPVIQLMIGTDSRVEHEQNLVLQLDPDALNLLRSTLDEIQEKLTILGRHT